MQRLRVEIAHPKASRVLAARVDEAARRLAIARVFITGVLAATAKTDARSERWFPTVEAAALTQVAREGDDRRC